MTDFNKHNPLSREKPHEILISEENNKSNYIIKEEYEEMDDPVNKLVNQEDEDDSLVNLSPPSTEEWQKSTSSSSSSNASTDCEPHEQEDEQMKAADFVPQILKDVANEFLPNRTHQSLNHDEASKTSPESINLENSHPAAPVHQEPAKETTTFRVYQKTKLVVHPSKPNRPSNIYYRQRLSTPLRNEQIARTKTNISIPVYHPYARNDQKHKKSTRHRRQTTEMEADDHWHTLRSIARFLLSTITIIVVFLGLMALYYVLDALLFNDYN
ncbi:hypothetical protein A0J61_03129 [Choanephora cucurbitarum]|uniref:Uncharacterized protein n=1 Tax=Choanephora cucurbitarum TaxID=101091 RepID=A0A1C7NI65_9FUNG|nr:hypothetical protein A0J61_03129 [Choanephora cucurbitarum]